MKHSFRFLVHLLTIFFAVILTSCIDGHEEFWIHSDGSGQASITYTFPMAATKFQGGEAGISRLVGEFLASAPGLKSSTYQVTTLGNRITVHVNASFGSLAELPHWVPLPTASPLPSPVQGLTGNVAVSVKGRTLDFSRTIDACQALPGALFIPSAELEGHKLIYVVHLPFAPDESNALRTENGGKTLTWEVPLAQAIRHPIVTRFKATVPIPGWLWMLVVASLSTAALVGFTLVRRKQQALRQRDA